MIIYKIVSVLALYGLNKTKYAEYMGMSKSSLGNKIKRGSWSAYDLIMLALMTDNKLAIIDKDNNPVIIFDEQDLKKEE